MQLSRILITGVIALALVAACSAPEERAARYLERAQQLFDDEQYTRARLEARNAAQIEPRNAEARYLLARIAEEEQEVREMLSHLFVAVDADPEHFDARMRLAQVMFFGQAYQDSLEHLEVLEQQRPEDPRVLILTGRHMAQQGDLDGAVAMFQRVANEHPDNVEALVLVGAGYASDDVDRALDYLAENAARLPADDSRRLREMRLSILAQDQRLEEMEAEYLQLVRDFPGESEYQQQLARFYAQQDRLDEADDVLRSIAYQDTAEIATRLSYVGFLATQRTVNEAEETLKAFIEETPELYELRLGLAEIYEASERPEEARRVYRELADLAPRSTEGLQARNRLAALDIRDGDVESARARTERILNDVPDNPQALLLRAALKFNENAYQDAISDLRVVLRREETNELALLLLGQAYLRNGERVLARDTYERLLAVNPEHGEGLMQLAAIYGEDSDWDRTVELLERRIASQSGDVLARGRLAEAHIQRGDLDKAEVAARALAELEGQEGLGDFQLGRVLQGQGRLGEAAESFRAALGHRPQDPPALEALANTLAAADRNAEAVELLEEHVREWPEQVHARYILASAYAREGDRERSANLLEQVIAERPQASLGYASLASLYPEDRERRIEVFRRGLEAIPGNPDLGMLLGSEYERSGRYNDAIEVYEEVVERHPEFDPAVNNLAALLLDHRDDAESVERALSLTRHFANSENPAMIDTLGWAYYRAGEYSQALPLLERAVSRAGNVPILRYHLAMTYLAMGNEVGAEQQLREALDREDVTFTGIDEARATLQELQAG